MADDLRELNPVQWHHRRHQALLLERSSWFSHWRDISENLMPRMSRWFNSDVNKGSKKNEKIIDDTGRFALNILTAGMMSGITSPARKWFRLTPPDPEMREFGAIKAWLDAVERIMLDVFRMSNFYRVLPSVYAQLGAYGTAPMFQFRNIATVQTFGSFTIGEYCIAQDPDGKVKTVYRDVPMTVKQVVDKYGDRTAGPNKRWSNFSSHVKNLYDMGNYDAWIDTVHVVHENPEHRQGSGRAAEFKYQQLVYEKSTSGQHSNTPNDAPMHEGGFRRFPVHVPRWAVQFPDVYGSSPGMDALGDLKQLQEQQRRKAQAIAKLVNPPMVASPALREERLTTLPGDVTYADMATGDVGFRPAYQVQPQLGDLVIDIEDTRARIRRHFYSDLFLAITDRPGVQPLNDSEVFERKEEKLLALGPVMENVDDDMLSPIIDNLFADLLELGLIPDPPPELQGIELGVEYLNIIAMAQRAQGLLGLQDTAAFVSQLAAGQAAAGVPPTAYDKFDVDQAIDEYGDKRGVPAGVIRSDEAVAQLRQQRAEQVERQQQAQEATQLSQAAKNLADVEATAASVESELGTPIQ